MLGLIQELEVRGLRVELFDEATARYCTVVSDVNLHLRVGEALGITGESGSGKTTLSLALSGLLPPSARVAADRFRLGHEDSRRELSDTGPLQAAAGPSRVLCDLRREHFFTLFQEPRASLNPHRTIGWQLNRCYRKSRRKLGDVAIDPRNSPVRAALADVGLDFDVVRHVPHELSTGMCQRVFLAMAGMCGSSVVVADEPFASVDPATQMLLAELVRDWLRSRRMMLILVSHDLELLQRLTDRTIVMFRGQVAEAGATGDVLGAHGAAHPYSRMLAGVSRGAAAHGAGALFELSPVPSACCFAPRCRWSEPSICREAVPSFRVAGETRRADGEATELHVVRCVRRPLPKLVEADRPPAPNHATTSPQDRAIVLAARNISKCFTSGWIRRRTKRVLDDVSFEVRAGDRLGVMGPSGQGKTTLARILLGMLPPSSGSVEFASASERLPVGSTGGMGRVQFRRYVQLLYQDTDLVLDPATRIGASLVEAYQVFNRRLAPREAYRLASRLIDELSLPPSLLEAYPYRLSGGERKRVALARCLAALGCPYKPPPDVGWRTLVMDEPTAGIDVVLQAMLSRFLLWAQSRLRLSYLVISHDEDFVRQFCTRTLRLENGHVVPMESAVPAASV